MKIDKIYLYTDGGSRGNPGPAAIGISIYDEERNLLQDHKECIGEATNNTAEYKALIKALELATAHCRREINCFLDSELVVRQLNGSYRIKAPHLRDLFYDIKQKEKAFDKVTYNHTNRDNRYIMNSDRLVNEALDDI
jgi:ribonuclease HI